MVFLLLYLIIFVKDLFLAVAHNGAMLNSCFTSANDFKVMSAQAGSLMM